MLRSYCDVDVDAAEQVEAYVLDQNVEKHLLHRDLDRLGGLGPGQ